VRRFLWLVVVLMIGLLLVAGCGGSAPAPTEPAGDGSGEQTEPVEKPKIIVGSKNFTEQLIAGEMVALLFEDAGYPVERKMRLGGTGLVHESLVNGEINVYVEYTGTGLTALLKEEPMFDPQAVYDRVKAAYKEKWNLVWLEPWGFNNTYTITMSKAKAEELGVSKISDLKGKAENMIIGATQEFIPRADGLAGLQEKYGFKFKEAKGMDSGVMYEALKEGNVDAISGFATDGRIPAFNFINLEDDLSYFPPYFAAPVVSGALLEQDPAVADILNKLANKIDDATMGALNYDVDGNKKEPIDVARKFLQDNGLIN
jgi:osmoprotectant transport system substrate-binding protein